MLETNWPQVNIRYHDYFSGPFVEIKTTEIEKLGEFLIRFYEIIGDKKELVDQKAIWGNNWYETPRKFYTNWYTEVLGFQNNKIVKVGWDRFDLYGKKVAIWLQNGYNNILDVNFHLETLPVIYAGEENYIRLPWDDLKSQPVLNSNRLHYDQFHPRNVIKLNLSPSEIARDILFGFDHNDLSYNNYYQSTKSILSSKQVWLP